MHPTQFSSRDTQTGTQPILFGFSLQANTSTGQMLTQKLHALHMSSVRTTSHLPALPEGGSIFSSLKSAMTFPFCYRRCPVSMLDSGSVDSPITISLAL